MIGLIRLISSLSKLPTETLHQVIDDVTLYHLLRLCVACRTAPDDESPEARGKQHITNAVLTHIYYQNLFPTPESLSNLLRWFAIYDAILNETNERKTPHYHPLSVNSASAQKGPTHGYQFRDIRSLENLENYIRSQVIDRLSYLGYRAFANLQPYTTTSLITPWQFSDVDNVEARWEAINYAQRRLNEARSEQLRRCAEIFEKYPTLLCVVGDPHDSPPRNPNHIIARLRVDSKRVLKNHIVRGSRHCRYVFFCGRFPLTPLEWTLSVFLRMVPPPLPLPPPPSHATSETSENAAADIDIFGACLKSISFADPETGHSYPPEIARDIETAILGMPFRYYTPNPGPKKAEICAELPSRRTINTPFSEFVEGEDRVVQSPSFSRGSYFIDPEATHNEKEFEWLEAFCRCVDYRRKLEGERKEWKDDRIKGRK